MVSLWGSKNENEGNGKTGEPQEEGPEHGGESSRSTSAHRREPDERTRLIPRNEAYLSPDDPAVSPYNLWSVRALRYFSVLFLMISFFWWTLLFVSIFVSPPYMNTRGSGFFDFSYTTLTIGNLLIALLFFAIPSKPMEILSFVITVMLLVNMIMIVSIPRLRSEESWVGVTSVIWATLVAFYNVVQDRAVARGKKREEQRLTGREEVRRPLREWCAVLTATIIMTIMVLVTILLTASLILRARDASLSYEGKRYYVNGDKYEVHLACVGNVTLSPDGKRLPTVLLEAGEDPIEGTFESLMASAVENGTIHRYCYWDRPGFGWSDNAPSPNSAGRSADDVSEALAIAGEQGPFVLVSAGIGSIYSRIFSSRHVRDVKGIFMIDPFHEDLLYQVGEPGRGFILWARGIIAPLGLDRLVGALFKGRTREDRVYGKSAYQNGKYIKAKLQENLVADSLTKNEISSARNIQTNKTPLVVVSSGIEVKKSSRWETKQEDLTKITKNLVAWDIVNAAPHEVWKTLEGRRVLEKRLGQLLKIASGEKNATSVYR